MLLRRNDSFGVAALGLKMQWHKLFQLLIECLTRLLELSNRSQGTVGQVVTEAIAQYLTGESLRLGFPHRTPVPSQSQQGMWNVSAKQIGEIDVMVEAANESSPAKLADGLRRRCQLGNN